MFTSWMDSAEVSSHFALVNFKILPLQIITKQSYGVHLVTVSRGV